MSIGKTAASLAVVSIVALVAYALVSGNSTNAGGASDQFGNDHGGFGSPDVRTLVTLTIVGGSAFITGFGLRDVIGRAVGRRQRNRMKLPEQKRP